MFDPTATKIPDQAVADINLALQQAVQAHQNGKFAQARQDYTQIITVQPTHAKAHQLLGLVHLQTGNIQFALKHAWQSVRLQPGSAH